MVAHKRPKGRRGGSPPSSGTARSEKKKSARAKKENGNIKSKMRKRTHWGESGSKATYSGQGEVLSRVPRT